MGLLTATLLACAGVSSALNIVETAVSMPDTFSTLVTALTGSDLVDTLSGVGPYTVFAPTNEAFAKLPAPVLAALLGYDLPKLKEILLYHVASGSVASTDLSDGQMVTSVNTAGDKISVGIAAEVVSLNGASTVTSADVMATNGVIHVLDTVITPPGMALPMNIVETAVSMPDTFSTLVAALTAANLVDTLSGDGPFTVFAPTDAAFAELPTATLTALLADPEALANILTYHVVRGETKAASLSDGMSVTTANGAALTVGVSAAGVVTLNGLASVATADVMNTNGVIHVIDKVLTPPDETPAEIAAAAKAANCAKFPAHDGCTPKSSGAAATTATTLGAAALCLAALLYSEHMIVL